MPPKREQKAQKAKKVAPIKQKPKPKTKAVKKLSPGSSEKRKEIIDKVRQYDPNITHGEVEAAFEGNQMNIYVVFMIHYKVFIETQP
ncbi:MAG: hypothetical protein EZS28_039006 [Streblomastix strix]|uniref:Uncharacterized protein n=1 Tax=Streblomastix strix TaxID=222440 RepID=A0A5J4U598_9EUKA|nr:MAG: hypothetical protein EZS28_039006 [Streblomastix strix]